MKSELYAQAKDGVTASEVRSCPHCFDLGLERNCVPCNLDIKRTTQRRRYDQIFCHSETIYTGSEVAVVKVRSWLSTYIAEHPCGGVLPPRLPTRVLRIDGPDTVTLLVATDELASHACLSHFRGPQPDSVLRTTILYMPLMVSRSRIIEAHSSKFFFTNSAMARWSVEQVTLLISALRCRRTWTESCRRRLRGTSVEDE
jgi:hypothetical protein